MAATKAGDVQTVLSLMADDVVFMVPGQKPFGKDAIAAAAEGMKNVRLDARSDIQELEVRGDCAFLHSYLEMTVTRDGAAPVRRSGYTLTIFRKEPDGRWLLARDANLVTSA
jgi:uncharacterized protein (TIGR02246 family)